MGFRCDHPDYSIWAEGAFVAPGLWLIHARIVYRASLGPYAEEALRPAARVDLWRGILHSSRVGRRLGADSIRVFVEGDRAIEGLFAVSESSGGAFSESGRRAHL